MNTSTRPIGRARDTGQGAGQGVDDVAKTAGLHPRLAFGADERDAQWHRVMVPTQSGRRASGQRHGPSTVPARALNRFRSRRADPLSSPGHASRPTDRPRSRAATFRLPPQLEGLRRLAYNLYWCWHPAGAADLEPDRSRDVDPPPQPDPGPERPGGVDSPARRHDIHGRGQAASSASSTSTWSNGADALVPAPVPPSRGWGRSPTSAPSTGFYESLGIYSGGLGVLAGDHTKTTSDMALPFIGVGLMYRKGYFHQTIDADGHQEHAYPDYDLSRLPVSRVQGTGRRAAPGHASSCRVAISRSRSGSPRSAGRRSCCSTPTSPRTATPTGRSPTSSTSGVARCGSTRSWSWASAACGRSGRLGSSRPSGI